MAEVKDHEIMVESGFYDFNKYPERIQAGTKMRVTKSQFMLMKGSDPDSIILLGVSPPADLLKAIVESARAEKAERDALEQDENPPMRDATEEEETQEAEFEPTPEYQQALDEDGDTLVDPPEDEEDWQPVGWYKAQLSKDGGLDD
jgi:hypothetical protein